MVCELLVYLTITDFLIPRFNHKKKSTQKFGMTHVFVFSLNNNSREWLL